MSPNLLVLPDVVVLSRSGRHQRPEIFLLVLAHVQEAGTHRREKPFVQARSVIITLEIVALEWKVRKRVRTIHEHLDSERTRQLDDLTHRHYLTGEIGDVCYFDDLGPRCDRSTELLYEIVVRGRWNLEGNLLQHDSFPPRALLPRCDHPRVVLVCHENFVAALEIQSKDHDLVCLGRVSRHRHLLWITAELAGQVAPNTLDSRLEHSPHVLHGKL